MTTTGTAAVAARPEAAQAIHAGHLLRDWRQRRRLTQLDLALDAEISTRHLSFVETGRARPSREMILRLSGQLGIPLRERNAILNAAGFAPVYPERTLADPAMAAARRAIEAVLAGHEPYPALAVDRHWTLLAANAALPPLLEGVADTLLAPPVNVLRVALHPAGLAPRVVNYVEWRAHLLERLRDQIVATADQKLAALHTELAAYPPPRHARPGPAVATGPSSIAVLLRLAAANGATLALLTTTTVFGTPCDVTLAELALECFYPQDDATAAWLREAAAAGRPPVPPHPGRLRAAAAEAARRRPDQGNGV